MDQKLQTRPGRYDGVVKAMSSIGWFLPPYVNPGPLEIVARQINDANGQFDEALIEKVLGFLYSPARQASMVLNRYPFIPVVDLYQRTISEAVAAHFSGLHHVAVGGLMPVVEGVGRELSRQRGLNHGAYIKTVFTELVTNAKEDAWARKIGRTQEIDDMLTGFLEFLKKYFFEDSSVYPFLDKTNRNGILHGSYRDSDYGRPINFYKTIGAVDILTFVSMLQTAKMSGFVPEHSPESRSLAERYCQLQASGIV